MTSLNLNANAGKFGCKKATYDSGLKEKQITKIKILIK
jgi:hypothetical protein